MINGVYDKKGQSIFEYFILTIIVVSIVLGFMNNQYFGRVKAAGNETFFGAVENITKK